MVRLSAGKSCAWARSFTLAVMAAMAFGCPWAAAQQPSIESVAPGEAQARVLGHKGVVILNITSTDAGCGFCARANVKFSALAKADPDAGTYLQTSWSPWSKFPPEILGFLRQNGIGGIPARLVYRDGVLINKVVGEPKDLAAQAGNDKPVAQRVTGSVPLLPSAQIGTYIAHTPGTLVVELTSFETTCVFCMRGNPVFEEFSGAHGADSVRFARVALSPWTGVAAVPFAQSLGINGLPVYLTYRDGKLLRRKQGIGSAAELQKELLDGVR